MSFSIPTIERDLAKSRIITKRLERKLRSAQRIELAEKQTKAKKLYSKLYKVDAIKILVFLEAQGCDIDGLYSAANQHFTLEG